MSKQGELTREIRAALIEHGPLSTKELSGLCHSALEPRDISRAIYDLRRVNKIEVDPVPGPPNGDGKPAKRYRWVGQTLATHVETIPQPTEEEVMPDSVQDENVGTMTHDATAEALSAIVEQAEEAVIAYANSLLENDTVWFKLRDLQRDCQNALHNYHIAMVLTDKVG